jgi:spermidine synthase
MDTLRHAYVDLDDPTHLEFAYTRLLGDVVDALAPEGEPIRGLHLGGGGFTMPRYIAATRPGSVNRILELDPVVLQTAREELGLETSDDLTVRLGDARISLAAEPTDAYDLVIGDAFAGLAVPWHLTTREVAAEVQRALQPGGIYAVNISDYPPLRLARAQLATFAGVFDHVAVFGPRSRVAGTSGGNVILLAWDESFPAESLLTAGRARGGSASLTAGGRGAASGDDADLIADFIDAAVVLTDDFAPADQLMTRFGG